MAKSDWLSKRGRGVHLTIRDVDCKQFDTEQFADDLQKLGVNVLSFFCAGYVTVHPTSLGIRQSPYLAGRDLTGDIVRSVQARDIRAIPAIDLSLIPGSIAKEHPDWCSCDHHGKLYKANEDLGDFYIACPFSGYQNEYLAQILKEIVSRYDVDGIKFGGGSYGFSSYGNGICHCERCKAAYSSCSENDIPLEEKWNDPNWVSFQSWRQQKVVDRSQYLYELVKSLDPNLPVMCNSVCFGETGWTMKGALDIERMAQFIDAVQVEAQTRVRYENGTAKWDFIAWPGEEANYLSHVTEHQPWVLASYFQAWPWRRSAVPPAEQKMYMAQIYANGGSAILNLSGGPIAGHQDKRGFPAVQSLYQFVAANAGYFDNDLSAANIAIVYSQHTLFNYGKDQPQKRYVDAIRGMEIALAEHHIPFDLISESVLMEKEQGKYRVIMLPSMACMTEEAAEALRSYSDQGGSIIASCETSLFTPDGQRRSNFLLADLFGADYIGTASVMGEDNGVFKQSYMNIQSAVHPLLDQLGETTVIPASDNYCQVHAGAHTEVLLTLSAPFRVFPEGMSYTEQLDTGMPMLLSSERESGSRIVYFPNQLDAAFARAGYPDWARLLVNAVRWSARGELPAEVNGPGTLHATVRKQAGRRNVHLVNMNGGRRMFSELIPARDVVVKLPQWTGPHVKRAYKLSNKKELPLNQEEGAVTVIVDQIDDYEVIVFESDRF
ncbi:alpha-amylase family protein [Paenibacillus sp. GXUN7292]|uniref:alpha-amylase family protein n=1 Tax=Paenibacillus sp. GXUN7292 TaxID=3422499 RepID=UPI003D7D12E2